MSVGWNSDAPMQPIPPVAVALPGSLNHKRDNAPSAEAASGRGEGWKKEQNTDFLHNFAPSNPILEIQRAILLKISRARRIRS